MKFILPLILISKQYHFRQSDMSLSYKVQPWTAFPKDASSILIQDFIHQKLLTCKVSAGAKKGVINYNSQIFNKGGHLQYSDQISVWFPVWKNASLNFISLDTLFKLHYNNGATILNQGTINWYGSYQQSKKSASSEFQIGALYKRPKYEIDNKGSIIYANNTKSLMTSHKLTFSQNAWSFSGFKILKWTQKTAIAMNALKVSYKHDQLSSFFIKALNNTQRQLQKFQWNNLYAYFDTFALNAVYDLTPQLTIAGELNMTQKDVSSVGALILKHFVERNSWGKIKIQNNPNGLKAALAYQGKLSDYGKWLMGIQCLDIGRQNNIRWGVQIDLNL